MGTIQVQQSTPSSQAGHIYERPKFAVEVGDTWGEWNRVNYLEAIQDITCLAPAVGHAAYRFIYGRIKREDKNAFIRETMQELKGKYIRTIRLSAGSSVPMWTGIIESDEVTPWADPSGAGEQRFNAFHIVHLLDRDTIKTANVAGVSAGTVRPMNFVPNLNDRYSSPSPVSPTKLFGNRSTSKINGVYYFSDSNGQKWTNLQALEMILHDYCATLGPTFVLGGQKEILEKLETSTPLYGRTPWDVINDLVRRTRGLVCAPLVHGDKVVLWISTCLDTPVKVGEFEIPKNASQTTLNLNDNMFIEDPKILRNLATRFDKLEIRGAPILGAFTLSKADASSEAGWDEADHQEAYDIAAENVSGYSGFDDAMKADYNDRYRSSDRFEAVYTKQRMPANWDGLAGSGDGGPKIPCVPVCDDKGEISHKTTGEAPFFATGKHFEDWLPFEQSSDYSKNPPVDTDVSDNSEQLFRAPVALVKYGTGAESGWRWYYVDRVPEAVAKASAHFIIYPRERAIGIAANPRHMYALNHFDAAEVSNDDPLLDWEKTLYTVAMRFDEPLRLVVTRKGSVDKRVKLIELPNCEYWFLLAGTVVDVGPDGQTKRAPATIALRDDRDRMRQVAAFLMAWYSIERNMVSIRIKSADQYVQLGSLLLSVASGGKTIQSNSVVSSISNTYASETSETTVQSGFAELDIAEVFSK